MGDVFSIITIATGAQEGLAPTGHANQAIVHRLSEICEIIAERELLFTRLKEQ